VSRWTRAAAAAGLLWASLVAGGEPAAAARRTESPDWLTVEQVPLWNLADIAPGDSGSSSFTVTNHMTTTARFSLRVVDLRSDDNGCIEPESEWGDTTCGTGGGELDDVLVLTVAPVGEAAAHVDVLGAWDEAYEDDREIAAGGRRTYEMAYRLPLEATNLVQSDRVSFALEMTLTQVGAEVLGAEVTRVPATAPLPRTGLDIATLVRVGAGVFVVGWLLALRTGRRLRRRASSAVSATR
jgi:hypothetical protein